MRHELQLLAVILIVICAEIYFSGKDKSSIVPLSIALFGMHTLAGWFPMGEGALFGGMYRTHALIHFLKNILDLGVLVVVLQTAGWVKKQLVPENRVSEFYLLLWSSLLGMYYMISSGDVLMLFIGLEMSTLPVAALAAYEVLRMRSAEAGIKMILMAGLASAITLMGISLLYGATGTFSLTVLSQKLTGTGLETLGFIFFFAGVAFKISLVPFHFWAPDVYEGAPTGIAGYLSVVSKGAAVFILMILLLGFAPSLSGIWIGVLYLLAILTMTIGNLFALRQQNLKRFLAYSSVAQAGFILLGFLSAGQDGRASIIYFVLVYIFSNLAAFGVVHSVEAATGKENMDDYEGFYRVNPRLAMVMLLALFSLAGIPPLAGFFGKFFLFMSAAAGGYYVLVLIAVLNTVISLYYYLLIVRAMFLRKSAHPLPVIQNDYWMRASLLICVAGILVLGVSSGVYDYIFGLCVRL
ncbi:MAG: NADH-quinone oxidoreductase subunit N [Thermoanaerobaculia bacterium]|nr:NADH-quinone oxidoreductase subunit N [Thermoanaerobaculia bacterium]